eukprot:766034-Hanusia_phi.AAC.6
MWRRKHGGDKEERGGEMRGGERRGGERRGGGGEMDVKAAMKARMAEAKIKQSQKIAQIKALKASMSSSNAPKSSEPSAKVKTTSVPPSLATAKETRNDDDAERITEKKGEGALLEAQKTEEPSKTVVSGVGLQLAYGDSDEESGSEGGNAEEEAPEPSTGGRTSSSTRGLLRRRLARREDVAGLSCRADLALKAIAHNKPPPKPVNLDEEFAAFQAEDQQVPPVMRRREFVMRVQVKQLVEERDKEDKEEQEELATRIDELKYAFASSLRSFSAPRLKVVLPGRRENF